MQNNNLLTKKRILVIEDDPVTTQLLKSGLERTGCYEVRAEHLGKRALAAAREFRPDLILLDVILPDIPPPVHGGFLATQIFADPDLGNTPIVLLSSMISEADEYSGLARQNGFQVLAKPVRIEKVRACLDMMLDGSFVT